MGFHCVLMNTYLSILVIILVLFGSGTLERKAVKYEVCNFHLLFTLLPDKAFRGIAKILLIVGVFDEVPQVSGS